MERKKAMAETSFAYVVGHDHVSRKRLLQAFDTTGTCVGKRAASLRSLLSLCKDDPKPDVILIDMADLTDLAPSVEGDLAELKRLYPDAEFLVSYPRDTYH